MRLIRDNEVAAVLCDWNLPRLTGIKLLAMLKDSDKYMNIPFIIVTGLADKDKGLQAAKFGVTDFLAKPVQVDLLEEKLEKVLPGDA